MEVWLEVGFAVGWLVGRAVGREVGSDVGCDVGLGVEPGVDPGLEAGVAPGVWPATGITSASPGPATTNKPACLGHELFQQSFTVCWPSPTSKGTMKLISTLPFESAVNGYVCTMLRSCTSPDWLAGTRDAVTVTS